MIITVTLNPAIDKTIEVLSFAIGKLNKVEKALKDPGGKGINVSKVICALGGESIATGFLGGLNGQYIKDQLDDLTIKNDFVHVKNETRLNLKVFDQARGTTTEINEKGAEIFVNEWEAMREKLDRLVQANDIVVLSGSMPDALPKDAYAMLTKACQAKGAKVVLDADGELFVNGINAIPYAIKPNRDELERYFSKTLATDEALIEAAKTFVDMGIEHVVISLGEEGAIYHSKTQIIKMYPLKIDVHSTVGAGDAFVAAFVYGINQDMTLIDCLKLATATSAGAVMTLGTKPMSREWILDKMTDVKIKTYDASFFKKEK